jgi:hypothetical protein
MTKGEAKRVVRERKEAKAANAAFAKLCKLRRATLVLFLKHMRGKAL